VRVVAAIGIVIVAGHNLLDGISPASFGPLAPLWVFLHSSNGIELYPGIHFRCIYTVLPWAGLMACGYALGALWTKDRETRGTRTFQLGLALTLLFIVLRYANVYGDPAGAPDGPGPWAVRASPVFTVLSFLNCQKYPPSLLYLLMTTGPALIFLGLADRRREPGPIARFLTVFGRVPLFFYVLHIPLIHGLAVLVDYIRFGGSPLLSHPFWELFGHPERVPPNYGISLGAVYVAWFAFLLLLYPVCRWYGGLTPAPRKIRMAVDAT
jgi:uncharacterized membrane protein